MLRLMYVQIYMDEVRPNSYSIKAHFGKCFENDVPRPRIFHVYIGGKP